MPQLDATWFASQLFWLAITFVMLYWMLSRWALPHIQGMLAERERTVSSDLSTAERLSKEAEQAEQHYRQALLEARERAQQLLSDAVGVQKRKAEEANKALDMQIAGMLSEAERKISTTKEELIQSLMPTSTELANLIVEKVTQQTLTHDKLQSIVGDVIKSRNNG